MPRRTPVRQTFKKDGSGTGLNIIDLFAALKGGGNNFGIVTAYTIQTHPISEKVSQNIFPLLNEDLMIAGLGR